MALSLPNNPDLERFRHDARRLQRLVRTGDDRALALVEAHHPAGPDDPGRFQLADAQLVVARRYGFASWPKLVEYLDLAEPLRPGIPPTIPTATGSGRAVQRAGLPAYSENDDPDRWSSPPRSGRIARTCCPAVSAPRPPPAIRRPSRTICGAIDPSPARAGRPVPVGSADVPGVLAGPPVRSARDREVLLRSGADPDAGYLWLGLPTPFTVLTGCFGEGEQGPGRQPRHPHGEPAGPAAAGTRCRTRTTVKPCTTGCSTGTTTICACCSSIGLGTGDGGVWKRRLGDAVDTPAEMMQRQVDWAASHGFVNDWPCSRRTGSAVRVDRDPRSGRRHIHRAGAPETATESSPPARTSTRSRTAAPRCTTSPGSVMWRWSGTCWPPVRIRTSSTTPTTPHRWAGRNTASSRRRRRCSARSPTRQPRRRRLSGSINPEQPRPGHQVA